MAARTPIFALALALATVSGLTAVTFSPPAWAAEKDKKKEKEPEGPQESKKVGLALQAAKEAIAAKQFDVAAAKINEAEALDKKTEYDQFQINEFRAYLYASQNSNLPELVALYEKSLETPQYFNNETGAKQRIRSLVIATSSSKQYDKTIDYAKRWLADNPSDKSVMDILGRVYYLTKDYPQARQTMQSAVDLAEGAGEKPEEIWLQLIYSSSAELDDDAGVVKGYEKLVRYYPKPDYWQRLLSYALQSERNDVASLSIFRLQAQVGVLNKADQYLEYAQLALEQAMPGEAYKIVQQGFDKNILGADAKDKARHGQLLATTKQKADADKAQLPQYEKEARASKATTGQLDAGLGLAYFSYDMYDQAIEWLDKGIKKGGLKDPDSYRIALGIAYLRKGMMEQARTELAAVKAGAPLSKVANLWSIRSYNN